jgi:hypothetical protein
MMGWADIHHDFMKCGYSTQVCYTDALRMFRSIKSYASLICFYFPIYRYFIDRCDRNRRRLYRSQRQYFHEQ